MAHRVRIERRGTDLKYRPVPDGSDIRPNEPLRLVAEHVQYQTINQPDFRIQTETGAELFRQSATAQLDGVAFVDTLAPASEGPYVLIVHVQSLPFLPFTHAVSAGFQVSAAAPPPPAPGGGFDFGTILAGGNIKWILIAALGFVVVREIGPVFRRRNG